MPASAAKRILPAGSNLPLPAVLKGASPMALLLWTAGLLYALFAGLHTVADLDLGWQLAMGRWMVLHHAVPTADVLSYTARGSQWIYPPLSSVILYGVQAVGGWTLLSWMGAAAGVCTVVLLLRKNAATAALALLAVPAVADRTSPRADMFTCVLFALLLRLLWDHRAGKPVRLWLLPLTMLLWVNLHLGFIAGLGLCAAYVACELGDAVAQPADRQQAWQRVRRSAPWLLASVAATLVNPWGTGLYVALQRQGAIQSVHQRWITEWAGLTVNADSLRRMVDIRHPESGILWLLLAALAGVLLACGKRRFGTAVLLAAAAVAVVHAMRFQALFAILVVTLCGPLFSECLSAVRQPWLRRPVLPVVALLLCALFVVRASDLVTNRYYMRNPQLKMLFGTGAASWYPEQAAEFVLSHQFVPNLYNDFNLGNYLAFRLQFHYPVYIDGRSVPYGVEAFFRSMQLGAEPLDSPLWRREIEKDNINLIMVSTDRIAGSTLSNLDRFCSSRAWVPVWLDTSAAVFVRSTPQTEALRLRCGSVTFDRVPQGESWRTRAERFHYHMNAAAILIVLGRNQEALTHLALAEEVDAGGSEVHYLKGLALQYMQQDSRAEAEFRRAFELDGNEANAGALSDLYLEEARYADAAAVLRPALDRAPHAYRLQLSLAEAELRLGNAQQALQWLNQAEHDQPFTGEATPLGAGFLGRLAQLRAEATQRVSGGNRPQ